MGTEQLSRRRFLTSAAPGAITQAPSGDYQLAQFAASLEAAAYVLYQSAGSAFSGASQGVGKLFANHHVEQAAAFETFVAIDQGGTAGPDASDPSYAKALPERANPTLLSEYRPRVQGGGNGALSALADLEEALAATYLWALGQFTDVAGAKTLAQVLPVSSQHAVALKALAGQPAADVIPDQQGDANRLKQADYPTPKAELDFQPGGGSSSGTSS